MSQCPNVSLSFSDHIQDTGLVHFETVLSPAGHEDCLAEFAHLSLQEFLGMAHISDNLGDIQEYLHRPEGKEDALLTRPFLFGLVCNTNNKWIGAVKEALGQGNDSNSDLQEAVRQSFKRTCTHFNPQVSFIDVKRPTMREFEGRRKKMEEDGQGQEEADNSLVLILSTVHK